MTTIHWPPAFAALERLARQQPIDWSEEADLATALAAPPAQRLGEFARLCIRLILATGDESLGLVPGEKMRLGSYALLCHALVGCRTLSHALHRAARYHAVLLPGLGIGLRETGEHTDVFIDAPQTSDPFTVELMLGVWLRFLQWLTASELVPLALDLRHAEIDFGWPAARVFGCAPRYQSPRYRLRFHRLDGFKPVVRDDAELRTLLADITPFFTRLMPHEQRLSQRVQQLLRQHGPALMLAQCARQLGTSPAGLRRRLAEEQTTFKTLKHLYRMELARRALRFGPAAIGHIAEQLGYSELSSFTRAFRASQGMSPLEFRHAGQASGEADAPTTGAARARSTS